MPYVEEGSSGFAFETITVTNAVAIGFTQATRIPSPPTSYGEPASRVVLTLETAPIRYRYDGVAPTTTVGHLMNTGDVLVFEGQGNMTNFKAIAVGTTATLQVTYES